MENELEELKELVFRMINRYANDYDDSIVMSSKIESVVKKAIQEARMNVLMDDLYD